MLRKHRQINDVVVFGSFLKSKFKPNDIDIMILADKKKEYTLNLSELKLKAHLEYRSLNEIFYEPILISLIAEGYSIKHQKYLKEIIGIKPAKLYIYKLTEFQKNKKIMFSTALTKMLKTLNGERVAAGAVLIPQEKTGAFEDFLNTWELKYSTKEYLIF